MFLYISKCIAIPVMWVDLLSVSTVSSTGYPVGVQEAASTVEPFGKNAVNLSLGSPMQKHINSPMTGLRVCNSMLIHVRNTLLLS